MTIATGCVVIAATLTTIIRKAPRLLALLLVAGLLIATLFLIDNEMAGEIGKGLVIGVVTGLLLSAFAADSEGRRRNKQIEKLTGLCVYWIKESRKEYANGRFMIDQLSKELYRYLPIVDNFLTADEVVQLSRGISYLVGRAEDRTAPTPESSPEQVYNYFQNVLAEFVKWLPFLKIDVDGLD